MMKTKEKNPIPETREQGKTRSDRTHINQLEKKAFDTPTSGEQQEKLPKKRINKIKKPPYIENMEAFC